MPDDIDDLLRTAMKTLDGQVPSGYFDALPERVSARLVGGGEEVHMQQDASGSTKSELSTGVPPVKRDEDSGLHDIRNLAQSTKQRLSDKRITGHPPLSHDDVLASSSASWKNLALPQPAKMVSLPEVDQLPSKQEIHAQEKAAKAAAKQAAREAAKFEAESPVVPHGQSGRVDVPLAQHAADSASSGMEFKPAFSQYGAPKARTSHKGRNLALVGMGLAAAAGVTLFIATQNNASSDKSVAAPVAAQTQTTSIADKTRALDEAAAKLQAQRAADAEKEAQLAAAPAATGAAAPPVEDAKDTAVPEQKFATPPAAKAAKHVAKTKGGAKADEVKPEPAKQDQTVVTKKKPEPGDPDFDKLLKEAGVQSKVEKPKLDKKQLSGDDFKKGMSAIQGKAQACFKGTQGTAAVKLTVAPSGQVSKVTVGGVFAGKPEADCVVSAVKSAQFPAWDGGPQSFGYPILLSE